jgi:FtsZ-binding cell division protein ZapB
MSKKMNVNAIILDPRLQSRVAVDEVMVKEFAEKMQNGDVFPPVHVYLVDGTHYYLVDGWHRALAIKEIGKTTIECIVTEGTWRDAKWASLAANNNHGLRPSASDKRKKITDCLEDDEWSKYSDSIIAEHCGSSRNLVLKVRQERNEKKPDTVLIKKGGKVVEQNITNVSGKKKKSDSEKPANPVATPEEVKDSQEEKYDARDDVIHDLKAANTSLSDRLAIAAFDASDEDKQMAEQTIKELREQVRQLEIELLAVKSSRDGYQKENSEMKKQILAMQKKLKSLEAK